MTPTQLPVLRREWRKLNTHTAAPKRSRLYPSPRTTTASEKPSSLKGTHNTALQRVPVGHTMGFMSKLLSKGWCQPGNPRRAGRGGAAAKLPLHSLPYHRESRRFSSHQGPSRETFFTYSCPFKEGCEGEAGMAVGTSPTTRRCPEGLRPLGFAPRAARGPPPRSLRLDTKKRAGGGGGAGTAPPSPLTPSPTSPPHTHTHGPRFAATPPRLSPHPPPGGAGAASPGVA